MFSSYVRIVYLFIAGCTSLKLGTAFSNLMTDLQVNPIWKASPRRVSIYLDLLSLRYGGVDRGGSQRRRAAAAKTDRHEEVCGFGMADRCFLGGWTILGLD